MWQNIAVDNLRVGHFIRLDYAWFAHPFPRNTFRISSLRDVALIRTHQLTRIEVDPERSTLELEQPDTGEATAQAPALPTATATSEHKHELQQWSALQVRHLHQASEELANDARRLHGSLQGLANGDTEAFGSIAEQVERLAVRAGASQARPMFAGLSFAQSRAVPEGIDLCSAIAMSQLVTARMNFDDQLRHHVGLATAMRQIGGQRFSASDRRESSADGKVRDAYKQYPAIGAAMLRTFVGMPPEVVRMVAQHRERCDGTGFPGGLVGSAIVPGALVIGAIHEFQLLTSEHHRPAPMSPAGALRLMYRDQREALGGEIIDSLIAALTVYPPGTFVELSDGSLAMVLQSNPQHRLSPLVMIINEQDDIDEPEILDLSQALDLKIATVLAPTSLPPAAQRLQSRGSKGGITVELPAAQA